MIKYTTKLSDMEIRNLPNSKEISGGNYLWSACPFCGTGEDRFVYWPKKGNYWCRKCETKGFVSDAPGNYNFHIKPKQNKVTLPTITQIKYLARRAEYYHKSLIKDEDKVEYWFNEGISHYSIKLFKLGWAYECPLTPYIDSYTIPYIKGKDIVNIRHRLNVSGGDKYRPEVTGLSNYLFNVNGLYRQDGINWPGDAILLEGEKKAIVFHQQGFRAVSIPGVNSWRKDMLKFFHKAGIDTIYVMLDPGMEEKAERLSFNIKKQGKKSKPVFLPQKPDDFLNNGHTNKDIVSLMY